MNHVGAEPPTLHNPCKRVEKEAGKIIKKLRELIIWVRSKQFQEESQEEYRLQYQNRPCNVVDDLGDNILRRVRLPLVPGCLLVGRLYLLPILLIWTLLRVPFSRLRVRRVIWIGIGLWVRRIIGIRARLWISRIIRVGVRLRLIRVRVRLHPALLSNVRGDPHDLPGPEYCRCPAHLVLKKSSAGQPHPFYLITTT